MFTRGFALEIMFALVYTFLVIPATLHYEYHISTLGQFLTYITEGW